MPPLRHRLSSILILCAALISGFGDGIIPVAFAIESYHVDHSGKTLTAVLVSLWLGRFLASLGVRRAPSPRRPALWMVCSDAVRLLAQFLLLLWLLAGGAQEGIAFVVSSFVYGCATAFFNPARFSLLAQLFHDSEREKINSTLSVIGDVLFVCGPLLGTALMMRVGFHGVLLIDSLSFLIGILVLSPLLRFRAEKNTSPGEASDSEESDTHPNASAATLPLWVCTGLVTWGACALAIGFLGVAGPTLVMNRFDESWWGWVAAGGAIGSLLGSMSAFSRRTRRIPWRFKQATACVLLSAQVAALAYSPSAALIVLAAILGSAATTFSGIAWDVLGQSFPDQDQVHLFATRDQLVNTAGIPLGMLLFGVLTGHSLLVTGVIALVVVAMAALCLNGRLFRRQPLPADAGA